MQVKSIVQIILRTIWLVIIGRFNQISDHLLFNFRESLSHVNVCEPETGRDQMCASLPWQP